MPLSVRQRDTLQTLFGATVRPAIGGTETYCVAPGNVIGAITVDEATLVIEPKVGISKLLFLLGYTTDPSSWGNQEAKLDTTSDLASGVAGLFTLLTRRALERGVLAGYHEEAGTAYTVRGRIDVTDQLRSRPRRMIPLSLRYVEHDEDTLENRLLRAAGRHLRRLTIRDAQVTRQLHYILDLLQLVSDQDFPPTAVPAVTWTRLNLHYRPAVELARLLLRHRVPDLASGALQTPALRIDMAQLFEDFVRTALRERLHLSPQEFPDGEHCPRLTLDLRNRVRLKPDLSWWHATHCMFIGDIKYKRDHGPGRSADLYQLLAYATATGLPTGTLIYADGPTEPHQHHLWGTPIGLRIVHLDLARRQTEILGDLANVAQHIRASAAAKMERGVAADW